MKVDKTSLQLAIALFKYELGYQPDINNEKDRATVGILEIGIRYATRGDLLSKDEYGRFHDILYDIFEQDLDYVTVFNIWMKHVPSQIKGTALQWGANDSVVGDELYTWAKKQNLNNLLQ